MPPPTPETNDRSANRPKEFPFSSFSLIVHGLILGGATVAVFLAGKPQEGAMGIFLACAGTAMVICPPRIRVDWRLWAAAAATAAGGALTLLPASWFSQPAWRRSLDATPTINMPATISTAPALTIFWLGVLILSLLIGLFLLSHPIRSRRLVIFALAASWTAAVYGGMSIYAHVTGWHYVFASDAAFGFFPNRNHTATLLFTGGLLALGVLSIVLREARWLVGLSAAASLAICGATLIFYSPSRGGVVFLLVGICLWFAGLGKRHRDTRLVVSFVVLLLASGILFLLSGGAVRDRLLGKPASDPEAVVSAAVPLTSTASPQSTENPTQNPPEEFRLKIYRDALGVVRDFPVTGVGLGTFALVFPQYRQASLAQERALHPESDWLMLTAEAGIPAMLCLLVFIFLAARRLRAERDHPYWPLRWGCAVAAATAALHGLVDVPLHRVQLGWWVLAVGGLALQSARAEKAVRSHVQHALFIIGGAAALVLGTALIRAQWFGGAPPPPFMVEKAENEIVAKFAAHHADEALDLAQAAVKTSPMAEPLYYQLGVLLLQFDGTDAEADAAFKDQRLLNPIWPAIPLQQGKTWITIDTARTGALWMDAVERQRRIDLVTPGIPDRAIVYYRELVNQTNQYPAVQSALIKAATRNASYALAWLNNVGAPVASANWDQLTNAPGLLDSFTQKQRQEFLLLWYIKGDRAAMIRFVNDHAEWQTAFFPIHLRQLADALQFEEAVHEAAAHYQIPLDLPASGTSDASPDSAESDGDPAGTFVRYWTEGNTIAARRVLDEPLPDGNSSGAAEYYRLKAALAVHDLDWPAAWKNLRQKIVTDHPSVGL